MGVDGILLHHPNHHVIHSVGMGMLLVQRSVRLEGLDVMMNVDVGMDGTRVGVYHADQCVGMGYG